MYFCFKERKNSYRGLEGGSVGRVLAKNSHILGSHPSTTQTGSMSVTPAHERWRQVQEFKAILHYIVGSNLAWNTRDPDSNMKEKQ